MNGELLVIGTVRGLQSEAEKIRDTFTTFKPDAVAISISKEQLEAMIEHIRSGNQDVEMDNLEEELYVKALERFGEVRKPPPSFVKAWELCSETEIPLYPIDFDDEEFTDLFCGNVSGFEWLRQPSRQRALVKRRFKSTTPEEFAEEWDKIVNRTKGMRKIETARENRISRETKDLCQRYGRVMLVVDHERSVEVKRQLETDCKIVTLTDL